MIMPIVRLVQQLEVAYFSLKNTVEIDKAKTPQVQIGINTF